MSSKFHQKISIEFQLIIFFKFQLDLSYNKIKKLPNNLTEWHRLEDGINLQGNPLHCDCESQWMLDDILNHLYAHTKHQHLLDELR